MILPAMLLAGMGLCGGPAMSQDDVFTVSDVRVDVTAENAVAARERAFSQAQVQAFRALAEKMMDEKDFATYAAPDPATIATMIKDFEVTREQLSAVRYIGTYTFRFEGNAVREHFRHGGVAYSDVARRAVLVLPFIQTADGRSILWNGQNPWLEAWAHHRGTEGTLVPVVVPMGDIRDVADIGDNESLTYRPEGMSSILARYGAGDAVVLIAVPDQTGASIQMYRTDTFIPQLVRSLRVDRAAEEDDAGLYARAVGMVRAAMQSDWRSATVINPVSQDNTLAVEVQYQTMQQWIETRQALMRVPGISEVKVRSVTPRTAQVDLVFSGDHDRLRLAMAQGDLILSAPQVGLDPYGYVQAMVYRVYLGKYAPHQTPYQ